jgi:restriction system protein
MGGRSGFAGLLRATVRVAAAAERDRKRAVNGYQAQARQHERQQRMALAQQSRDNKTAEKLAKAEYLAGQQDEVDDLNAELQDRIADLQGILTHTLTHDDCIDFDSLRITDGFEPFQPPAELSPGISPPTDIINAPNWFGKLLPGADKRHAAALNAAKSRHQTAMAQFKQDEAEKRSVFANLKHEYERKKALYEDEKNSKNAEIDAFQVDFMAKERDAVESYNDMVLSRSEYPEEGFLQMFRLVYLPESAELVVEYDLPDLSLIPAEVDYRYVKSKDAIESKARKSAEIKQLYQDVIASITLRTLHELFEADQADALALITFNGVVDTHDPASGREVRVPLVSVRAPKSHFLQINLEKIDKIACLRNLGAQVSSRPDELQAIKPIVEFDMIDKRFIDQGDALTGLESRPNLMDSTPGEFEVLISNLFTRMGLDTKLTQSSRDGGVDAVAFDTRPVLGGKVVIQAKRYRDTVGVSAVRDLYGTMMNEGANKGILVCTSRYGPDAYNFSKDKPIELIDGGGLLYLLREHAGTHARIVNTA